jgi:hypothetical protein
MRLPNQDDASSSFMKLLNQDDASSSFMKLLNQDEALVSGNVRGRTDLSVFGHPDKFSVSK